MDIQSLASLWACLTLSVLLIAIRLILRQVRRQGFTRGDYWCLAAAVFILARLISNHFLLLYGSTRTLSEASRIKYLQPEYAEQAFRVTMGSKLVLCTRALLICILWCLKMAVLDLLARLIMKMPYELKVMYSFWVALALTFIASLTTVYASCQPFQHYWQIYPDPGECVVGNLWLYTYEISNIITDVLLMLVSVFLIIAARISTSQQWRIFPLFGIGAFLIAISILRMVQGIGSQVQRAHTLWASLKVLFATIVAVTPTIYALARNRREDASYANTRTSMKTAERTHHNNSIIGRDLYSARIWVELEDGASRTDNASMDGISVETRREMSGAKL